MLFGCCLAPTPSLSAPLSESNPQEDCKALLSEFQSHPDHMEKLLDPIILDKDELEAQIAEFQAIHSCLVADQEGLTDQEGEILRWSEYFLIFTDDLGAPPGATRLELVDLGTSDDPAVILLREEAGLPAPPGYVFVRYYSSIYAMPPALRRIYPNSAAGITFMTRYIAVLEGEPGGWQAQVMQSLTLPETTSHELVHAYLHASVGLEHFQNLPDWYNEGIAIYLSGSGEDQTVVGADMTLHHTSPETYQTYRDQFRFLQAQMGRRALMQTIHDSVSDHDPTLVYRQAGFESEEAFFEASRAYFRNHLYLAAAGVILLVFFVVWRLLRLMPDFHCENCGYSGKKREILAIGSVEYCPNCRFPLE
jgi:hypothetical protein